MRVDGFALKGASRWRALLAALVAAAVFHLPSSPVQRTLSFVLKPASASAQGAPDPSRPAASQAPGLRSREPLDSSLLPLLKDTFVPPESLGIAAGAGGAITVIDDKIIICDLQGSFFKAESKGDRIDRLDLPALANHRKEYDEFGPRVSMSGPFVVNYGLVVHDIESKKESAGVRLFVSYERFLPQLKTTALAVSTIMVDGKDFRPLGAWEDIYQSQPLHAEWYAGIAGGGRLLVLGDKLYVTVGDYNQDNVFMKSAFVAQNPDTDFGKILSIDLHTKQKTVVSIGHRNPQGLAVTSGGTIYATEHGPRGGDLLTKVVPGSNYGWPLTTFGTHYTTYDWPNRKYDSGTTKFDSPVFAWVPSIATSNLIEVVNFHPAWNHDLLIGTLKSQSLFRLRQDESGRVLYSEPIVIGERLRDIASLSDGTIVMYTDLAHLIFLTVDIDKLATNARPLP